eukprot:scaffold5640_cov328-Prasinococcus_capsulatus_cf.AAC.9
MHGLRVLDGTVVPLLLQLGGVIEEPGRERLADGVHIVGVAALLDFHTVAEALELLSNVPGPLHAPHLHEVLVAPLRREVRIAPALTTRRVRV